MSDARCITVKRIVDGATTTEIVITAADSDLQALLPTVIRAMDGFGLNHKPPVRINPPQQILSHASEKKAQQSVQP